MASDLAVLVEACRDWVPVNVDDTTLLSALDRNGNDVEKAALSVCRRALTALMTGATTFSVAGDASEDNDSLIKLLQGQITQLERRTGDLAGSQQPVTSVPLVPPVDLHRGRWHQFPNLR